jgi:hypothetical protein
MNYNDIKIHLFSKIDKSVNNNNYYFDIYNIKSDFYNIYKSTIDILVLKNNSLFIEISILFEFLLNNYSKFCKILDRNDDISMKINKDITTRKYYEAHEVLCFLNVNIFIVEHLNDLFKKLDLKDSEIQECLDACNFSFMEVNDVTYKNYRGKILGFFNKIIEVYSSK